MMVNEHVQRVLDAVKERSIERVFFVACGGSSSLMYSSKYILDREAETITSDLYSSNEFIHRNPRTLNERSLVILCSLRGNTPETVEAAKFARSKGAITASMTNLTDSPLAQASEYVIPYSWGGEVKAEESNYGVLYQLVLGVLSVKEGNKKLDSMLRSMPHFDSVYAKAKQQFAPTAQKFAVDFKDESVIYTMASGANYGIAYMFAICFLMEMQWKNSHAIHAGEFFHGPFEILDKQSPFILFLGLDETRPLEERALKFLRQYGEKLLIIDAKDYDFTGIEEDVKGYVAPLVLNQVIRQFAAELAKETNHPLETRRYMWKVAY
ncbi:fructoselysine 6-phosphate deglycase [Paenibacillus sp. UNCCL117]|uniref:SIS domain-containing protein n=1 Tax=unclassified Paenibacillus TaxID=185978 RepID=UPI00087E3792|nr:MULTISPECIES: SIS domain-containing protein [unclassified Paenibacillus]SDE23092.1 fructoselysine 6-phosphate deglycase [Paenibacillus sp. cl123]SFW42721.1 fructoselysine 6-phosphate deglycase [Paenibacillus sp. UNCCL117]